MVAAGEKEPAVDPVLEPVQKRVGKLGREPQIFSAVVRLHQLQQRSQQEGVIVEIGVEVRPTIFIGRQQPAIAP